MPLSDDDLLLDLDYTKLAHPRAARMLLDEHGHAYRYQLVTARHLDLWADRTERRSPSVDKAYTDGYARALRDVAAHLRQGAYLPSGVLYDETVG